MAHQQLWIVTGSSRGLGAALVRQLKLVKNATVLSLSRGDPSEGSREGFLSCDLSSPYQAEALFKNHLDQHLSGKSFQSAVLVNNAATIQPIGISFDHQLVIKSASLNLIAPILLTRVFLDA